MFGIGDKIGNYEIVALLKAGGMGTLFLGRRVGAAGFSRHVAIKVIHPHLATDPALIQSLINEALLASRITHPNVVHVEELGQAQNTYFIAMEYVHGCTLAQFLKKLTHVDRHLPQEYAVAIATHVAAGLHAAHEATDATTGQPLDLIHRDVSPQNVLLSSSGHIKLIDFGVAKVRSSSSHSATGALKGKLRYMAPEQAYGKPVDRRTDVYALGIVLWEMLARRRMFESTEELALLETVRHPNIKPPSEFMPGQVPELESLLMKALTREPEQRPATAEVFRQGLLKAMPKAGTIDASTLSSFIHDVIGEELDQVRRTISGLGYALASQGSRPPEERPTVVKELEASELRTINGDSASYSGVPPAWIFPEVTAAEAHFADDGVETVAYEGSDSFIEAPPPIAEESDFGQPVPTSTPGVGSAPPPMPLAPGIAGDSSNNLTTDVSKETSDQQLRLESSRNRSGSRATLTIAVGLGVLILCASLVVAFGIRGPHRQRANLTEQSVSLKSETAPKAKAMASPKKDLTAPSKAEPSVPPRVTQGETKQQPTAKTPAAKPASKQQPVAKTSPAVKKPTENQPAAKPSSAAKRAPFNKRSRAAVTRKPRVTSKKKRAEPPKSRPTARKKRVGVPFISEPEW